MSWVTYVMEAAGPVTLEVILPGTTGVRTFRSVCAPTAMSLAHSALVSEPAETAAGRPCSLVIEQHDR